MYVIREVMYCRPGKVRSLVEKFKGLSTAFEKLRGEPLRLLTDASGEQFWSLVVEARVERVDDFFAFEQQLMADEAVRDIMAGYHDLVQSGRREIYRLEA